MAKQDNFKGKGKDTRFPKNDPTKGGRKPSIRNQLKELLEKEGKIKIDPRQVVSIEDDGGVIIKLPTQMQLAMKLQQWALSKKGNDSIKAIQMIMEQIDGKPKQEIDLDNRITEVPLFPDVYKNDSDK